MEKLTLERLQSIWESKTILKNIDIVVILAFNSKITLGTLWYYSHLDTDKSVTIAEGEINLIDIKDGNYILFIGGREFIINQYCSYIDEPSFNMSITEIGTLQFSRKRNKL